MKFFVWKRTGRWWVCRHLHQYRAVLSGCSRPAILLAYTDGIGEAMTLEDAESGVDSMISAADAFDGAPHNTTT